MLKYSIKLNSDNIKQEELVWGEKYLSPDLSFVSGTASQDYHLEKLTRIAASNTISHTPNSILPIESENVTRKGFVIISGKTYDIESGITYNDNIDYSSVLLNGKYYYLKDGMFLIDDWLQYDENTKDVIEAPYSARTTTNSKSVNIDTIAWIEDDIVTIDGNTYLYDFNLDVLRDKFGVNVMEASAITNCDSIECHSYSSTSEYKYVTKFKLTKEEEASELFENVSFVKYFYYILYKGQYFTIIKDGDYFKCQIPYDILNEDKEGLKIFTDTYIGDNYEVQVPIEVSGDSFDVLRENLCYVNIDEDKYEVQNDILNANDGSEIGIYLDNEVYNISVGDIVYFVDNRNYDRTYSAYTDENGDFVLFRSDRYDVIDSLCDKVLFKDNEYEIEYINGKTNSAECVVHIDYGDLSMIVSGDNLVQKGLVVSGSTSFSAVTAVYPIVSYSGVSVDGVKYQVDLVNGFKTVEITKPNEYKFIVSDIIGSSMLVCKPYLSNSDFSQEFINSISQDFCRNVVSNQRDLILYFKNKIFGVKEITKELAINEYSGSTSSDDYFDLFDNFTLYTANAYIHVPLLLENPQGNNIMQDDIVNRDFFEAEKKKAINPIIDMEKDVYSPKYFEGVYNGSSTDFKEIREIRFNLHFRTRNLESWKVNEAYNNVAASADSLTNWFVTDFYPYAQILSGNDQTQKDALFNSSDLLGLLNFTNDDVYFQKSKLAKSFLRFTFYDSVNQQEQALLGMSSAFMDEHRTFKIYMDNSRKGEYNNQFLMLEDVFDNSANTINKISVKSEFLKNGAENYINVGKKVNNGIISSVTFDDEHRLGSEIIINNKYETDTSSEGYYLYMFREYSEKLTPKPIYMKVEFNHAGIGRTIPLIIPMKWKENENSDGNKYPVSALTFNNLDELKAGIKLEDSYAQSYIPLYAVYDFKHREYAYVFDRRYADVDENGVLTLNLFEIKFADDTTSSTSIQKDITYGKQPTAKIDMNIGMFGNMDKTCGGCHAISTTYKYEDVEIGCESAATITVIANYTATTTYTDCETTIVTGNTDFTLTNITCNGGDARLVTGYESNVESTVFANAHPKITQNGGCSCCLDYNEFGTASTAVTVNSPCAQDVTIIANVPYTSYRNGRWGTDGCVYTTAEATSSVTITVHIEDNNTQEEKTITGTENYVTYEITQPAGPCGGCHEISTMYKYEDIGIGCESAATKTVTATYTATTTYTDCTTKTEIGTNDFVLENITCNGGEARPVRGYENNVESFVFANAHPMITQSGGCSCCSSYIEIGTADVTVTANSSCAQDVAITADVPYTSYTGTWGIDECTYITAETTSSVTITVHVNNNNTQQSVTTTGTSNNINYTIVQLAGPCGGCHVISTSYKYEDVGIGCESAATTTVTATYTATTTYDNCESTTEILTHDFKLYNIDCNGGEARLVRGYESNVESTVFANAHPKITQSGGCSCCSSYIEIGTANTTVSADSPCAQDIIITAGVPYTAYVASWGVDECEYLPIETTSSVTITVHVSDNNTQQIVTTTGTKNRINYTIVQPAGPCGGCTGARTTYKYADVTIGCESAATKTVTATYTATTTYDNCATTTAIGSTDFTLTNITCNDGNARTVSGYENNVTGTTLETAHPKITQNGGCPCSSCECGDFPSVSDVEMTSNGTNGVEGSICTVRQLDENCFTLGTPTSSEGFVHDLRISVESNSIYIYGIVDVNNSTNNRTATITIPFTLKDGTSCTSKTFTLTQRGFGCSCNDLNNCDCNDLNIILEG